MITSWILELVERVTGPMRSVRAATVATSEAVENVQERVVLSQKGTEIALNREKQHRREVVSEIKKQEKELRDLDAAQKKATGDEWQKNKHAIEQAKKALEQYQHELQGIDKDLEDLNSDMDRFQAANQRWQGIATGANQASEMIDRVAGSLDFGDQILETQANLQRMTGFTGEMLDNVTGRVHHMAAAWRSSDEDIARSANAMSDQLHISYDAALDLIEKGFSKGANINGDMLDQMKEYGPQMKELGLDANQFIALMAQAGKDGVFSDKAIDSIKEANLSLKEMGQPQIDALKGIGLSVKDLAGKTAIEAVQMVSKAMEGATAQAKQLALTDIFKGAGEDAGMAWVLGLSSVDMNIDNIPSVQEAGAGMRGFVADIQTWVATTMGSSIQYIQGFGQAASGINSVIGLISTLRATQLGQAAASGVATAAQWAWNVALTANPIGIVVVAIAALVGGIVLLAQKFSWANGVVEAVKTSWKEWGGVIMDFVLFPLNMVIGALSGIWKLLQGDFSGAMKAFSQPVNDLANSVGGALNATKTGYQKGYDERERSNAAKAGSEKKMATGPDTLLKAPTIDGKITPPGGSKSKKGTKGSGSSDGLSLGGSGGSKSITMNLTVHNHFNGQVKSSVDIRELADKVAEHIADQVKDRLID
ncbi:Phage-related minor tail protein [compost metagenome]